MSTGTLHRYESAEAIVTWDESVCVHAAECVRGLPAVFDPRAKPWVRLAAADVEAIAETVARCPSGALKFHPRGEAAAQHPPSPRHTPEHPMSTATLKPNGPYVCSGDFDVAGKTAAQAALCRCGHSANKPYCDGSHAKHGFTDAGHLPASAPAGHAATGRVAVSPLANGPLKCDGPLTLAASDGRHSTSDPTFLCRCGHSANKPYCDGTHKKIGFTA